MPFGAFTLFQLLNMEDKQNSIGLRELLNEVSRDLDEFRKKYPNDYSVKGVTLWWELERERLETRHNPGSVVKKLRSVQGFKWVMIGFFAGCVTMLVANTVILLLT